MPQPRSACLADVARAAGVSPSSASRILNDAPGFRASEAVRARVRETAQRLGYRPDPVGRALRTQRSNVIGILGMWSDMLSEGRAINRVITSASDELFRCGYDVVVSLPRPGHARFRMGSVQIDGALLLIPGDGERFEELDAHGIPYVSLDGPAGSHGLSLRFDDVAATELLMRHVLAKGHRRIAWWSPISYDHHSLRERVATFHRMLAESGASACPVPERCDAAACLGACRTGGATAVIAYGAMWAVQLHQAAVAAGLRIPEDLALATFNDDPAATGRGLATIAWPTAELGRVAANLLTQRLAGQEAGWTTRVFTGQLIAGSSV